MGKEAEEIREAGGWGEPVSKAALLDWMQVSLWVQLNGLHGESPRPLSNQRSPEQPLCWEGDGER